LVAELLSINCALGNTLVQEDFECWRSFARCRRHRRSETVMATY